MIVIKRYDLNNEDDVYQYGLDNVSNAMYSALWDIKQEVRSIWKHREHTTLEQAQATIGEIYDIICRRSSEVNLDL